MSLRPTTTRTRELSGITPSGALTLGNYLGALRRFRGHQDNGFYFVANLHALTTEHQPARLRQLTLSTAALFFASGLDADRATVFVQSDVAAHVELGYLLECTAHVGELGRMIQFKEKVQEITTRLPGRVDPTRTTYTSTDGLEAALRRAAKAHGTRPASARRTRTGLPGTRTTWCASAPGPNSRREPGRARQARGCANLSTALAPTADERKGSGHEIEVVVEEVTTHR
jgi:hypothetical protein